MEKEALVLGIHHRLRGKLDEGMDKGGVMTAMVKDLINIEEAAIRREAMGMRLSLP